MQGVTPFKGSPPCFFHKNTRNRGYPTKLQQNCDVLGWHAPPHPKSLSRRAFDHPLPIGREGLLTCLLHFSLRVKGIMVSVVSQILRQDLKAFRGLNISDSHHLAATFYLRGHLNTSIFRCTPQQYSISRTLEDFQITSIFFHTTPHQYSIPRGLPAIVSIINLSSCFCVASGETLMGGSPHMWPLAL